MAPNSLVESFYYLFIKLTTIHLKCEESSRDLFLSATRMSSKLISYICISVCILRVLLAAVHM